MKNTIFTNVLDYNDKFNTSNIYFEINKVDTFSTKFINIDAIDYIKLEKAYTKNISINIKYLNSGKKQSTNIGNIELTCFDLNEALLDNADIEEVLEAEGKDTSNIYTVIISNFNKEYYDYFGYKDVRNIANITNINIKSEFQQEIFYYTVKNLHKIVYHLLGVKISTILTLKNFKTLENTEDLMNTYTNLGFLEVDNESDFIAKNLNTYELKSQNLNNKFLSYKEILISDFKNIIEDKELCKSILNGNANL